MGKEGMMLTVEREHVANHYLALNFTSATSSGSNNFLAPLFDFIVSKLHLFEFLTRVLFIFSGFGPGSRFVSALVRLLAILLFIANDSLMRLLRHLYSCVSFAASFSIGDFF